MKRFDISAGKTLKTGNYKKTNKQTKIEPTPVVFRTSKWSPLKTSVLCPMSYVDDTTRTLLSWYQKKNSHCEAHRLDLYWRETSSAIVTSNRTFRGIWDRKKRSCQGDTKSLNHITTALTLDHRHNFHFHFHQYHRPFRFSDNCCLTRRRCTNGIETDTLKTARNSHHLYTSMSNFLSKWLSQEQYSRWASSSIFELASLGVKWLHYFHSIQCCDAGMHCWLLMICWIYLLVPTACQILHLDPLSFMRDRRGTVKLPSISASSLW